MSKAKTPLIHGHMPIADIIAFCPEAKPLLAEYGLHCFHCAGSEFEALAEGCRTHGFSEEEISDLIDDVNDLLASQPSKPKTLTVTAAAARAIRDIAAQEKRLGEGLAVIVDGSGGFCMEFRSAPESDEETFINKEVPDVRVFASRLTLARIGGSTIDLRDGRFKLDLPANDPANSACSCSQVACSCKKSA